MLDARGALAETTAGSNAGQMFFVRWRTAVSATAWDLFSERLEFRDDPTSQGFGQTSSSSIRDVLSDSRKRRSVHRGGVHVSGERPVGAKGSSRQR